MQCSRDDTVTISRVRDVGRAPEGVDYERTWAARAVVEDVVNVGLEYFDVDEVPAAIGGAE